MLVASLGGPVGTLAALGETGPAVLDAYAEDTVAEYGGMSRMVNRNDETVSAVFVGGRAVFLDGVPTETLGRDRTGSFLRAGRPTPAPTTKGELADGR